MTFFRQLLRKVDSMTRGKKTAEKVAVTLALLHMRVLP